MKRIWIHSSSHLISRALATLIEPMEFEPITEVDESTPPDAAIWHLHDLQPPYPWPPECPTLAIVRDLLPDKMSVLQVGYRGYLSGDEEPEELKRALCVVLAKGLWAERYVLDQFVCPLNTLTFTHRNALTHREHQVHSLLIQGLSNKEIAQRLDIAEKTVKVYVSSVLDKKKAKSRMELVTRHMLHQSFSLPER